MACVRIMQFKNPTVPHRMEIPGHLTGRIDRLADEFHLHIIPPMVLIIGYMKRLMEVAHQVDEILEGLLALLNIAIGPRQHVMKAFDLTNHTLILGADAGG